MTKFWCEVADNLLIGERKRVPYIGYDYFKEEWDVNGNNGIIPGLFVQGLYHVLRVLSNQKRVMIDLFMIYLSY